YEHVVMNCGSAGIRTSIPAVSQDGSCDLGVGQVSDAYGSCVSDIIGQDYNSTTNSKKKMLTDCGEASELLATPSDVSNHNDHVPIAKPMEASSSNPGFSPEDFGFGEPGESDEDEVYEPVDVTAIYMFSFGGGQQLKDDELDFHMVMRFRFMIYLDSFKSYVIVLMSGLKVVLGSSSISFVFS
nr:hypothetical protein [Tanacetum cinerariifolium]